MTLNNNLEEGWLIKWNRFYDPAPASRHILWDIVCVIIATIRLQVIINLHLIWQNSAHRLDFALGSGGASIHSFIITRFSYRDKFFWGARNKCPVTYSYGRTDSRVTATFDINVLKVKHSCCCAVKHLKWLVTYMRFHVKCNAFKYVTMSCSKYVCLNQLCTCVVCCSEISVYFYQIGCNLCFVCCSLEIRLTISY